MSTRGGITGLLDDQSPRRIVPLMRQCRVEDLIAEPSAVMSASVWRQLCVERIRLEVHDGPLRLPIIASYRVYERISTQRTMVALLVPSEDIFDLRYGAQLVFPYAGQVMYPHMWHEYIRFTGRVWAGGEPRTDVVARYWVSDIHDGSERDPLRLSMRGGVGTYQTLPSAVDAGVNDLIDRFDREESR